MAETVDKTQQQQETLRELIARKDQAGLHAMISKLHPADSANLVAQLLKRDQKVLFSLLSAPQAADVVEEMEPAEQVDVVKDMPAQLASDILEEMESDKGVDLLQDLPREERESLIHLMRPMEAAQARELLDYPEDCAGGLMAKEFIALRKEITLQQAIALLQRHPTEVEDFPISYLYVVEEDNKLVGVLRIRDVLLKNPSLTVESIMIREPITVGHKAGLSEIGIIFDKYHLLALPVVDDEGKMLGIIQHEDVSELMQEEASKGLLKFMGIAGGEEYRDMPLRRRIGLRLPWLTANIFLNVLAASVIAFFEDTLTAVVALAVFLPIVSDMSGCSGGQAAAVSIREIALGRLSFRRIFWLLRKELAVGLINGLALGLVMGAVAYLWKGLPFLGLVVCLALWANIVVAVSLGSCVPVLLKRAGVDPAIATTPLLTTITDACGFFLVMVLATAFLPLLH